MGKNKNGRQSQNQSIQDTEFSTEQFEGTNSFANAKNKNKQNKR